MGSDALWGVGERYRLLRRLGQGGMASVWVAVDRIQGGQVAIKFLAPTYAALPEFRARFEQEAIALEQLSCPNIVQVHGHGVDEHGRPYIVMELLDGEDLHTRLALEKRLNLIEASALLAQIANALQHAHAAGIVHRDLKPANIFCARSGGGECVKLIDFGIAKIKRSDSSEEATKTGTVLGTFNYMSPEQMRDSKSADSRSDVWSLGIIAFRMITGQLPFRGQNFPELFLKICCDPIPRASAIVPELRLSAKMDAFFARALERDRQRRFQTALELVEELECVIRDRTSIEHAEISVLSVETGPPEAASSRTAAGRRLGKFMSDLRGLKIAAIVIGLVCVSSTSLIVWRRRSIPVIAVADANVSTSVKTDEPAPELREPAPAATVDDRPKTAPPAASPTGGTAESAATRVAPPAPSMPVRRAKDSYCEVTYPDKPYASSKPRAGCVKTSSKHCCP